MCKNIIKQIEALVEKGLYVLETLVAEPKLIKVETVKITVQKRY